MEKIDPQHWLRRAARVLNDFLWAKDAEAAMTARAEGNRPWRPEEQAKTGPQT